MDQQAKERLVRGLWQDMDRQNWQALPAYFSLAADIFWHDSDERFDVSGFQRANSEYPGDWRIQIQCLELFAEGSMLSIARVAMEGGPSFHVCSFFAFDEKAEKISRLDEYWGEVGPAPEWRRELGISRPIN